MQFVAISAENAGQRIDNYLLSYLKGVPKSLIYRILRKGEVRVNKGRVKPVYRLKEGDEVRIPPVRIAERTEPKKPSNQILKKIEDSILFEDKRLIVLNKPSGIAVHGGSGLSFGIIEALRHLRPNDPSLELVHRLDRDTSGCLVISKKRSTLRRLHEKLRTGGMHKQYLSLLKDKWEGPSKWIDMPLVKNVMKSGERMVFADRENGKSARTEFIPYAVTEKASLMTINLDTGRTHQIRVHAAYTGHPVAGDEKYGDDSFNKWMKSMGLKRLFLHASSLSFDLPDPKTEEPVTMRFTAPIEPALINVLNNLGIDYES